MIKLPPPPPGPKDIGNLKWCRSVSPAYKELRTWSDFKRSISAVQESQEKDQ